ncbi:hypothetical protein EYC56_18005 [Xanthomonas oryzae]|nr:hypothetical protein EYC56_18005 [Xanthomonas oryzae]
MPPHSEQIVSRICGALFRGSLRRRNSTRRYFAPRCMANAWRAGGLSDCYASKSMWPVALACWSARFLPLYHQYRRRIQCRIFKQCGYSQRQ